MTQVEAWLNRTNRSEKSGKHTSPDGRGGRHVALDMRHVISPTHCEPAR